MKVILRARQQGKTTEIIKRSHETGGYIVCRTVEEAHKIQEQAVKLGYKIPLPITVGEFINKEYYGKGIKSFLIDNADYLLQSLTDVRITDISISPK